MKSNAIPGNVMLDLEGGDLTEHDRRRLLHPMTGGVILFSRNYESPGQIATLTEEIRALRSPPLLIAVDHEGGRVQRFRKDFTRLPAMRELGQIWNSQPRQARDLARDTGFVLAAELRACGIDLSFTPVLDLDYQRSGVIGDRAFHAHPLAVSDLASALVDGLRLGGMAACGKHFPGHGYVTADSHVDVPVDNRSYSEIEASDLVPFRKLIQHGLSSVMPAHVIYPLMDDKPAGFSSFWLAKVLRGDMGFQGLIFSDDLSMEGACVAGGILQRAHAALDAGCDMVLVCNHPGAADELLAGLSHESSPTARSRLAHLYGRGTSPTSFAELGASEQYVRAAKAISAIEPDSEDLASRTTQVGESG